jgi:hypothetical protein
MPIDQKMLDEELRQARDRKKAAPRKELSGLDAAVANRFGFDPEVERLGLLPYPRGALTKGSKVDLTDWVAPQFVYDAAKAFSLPGYAAQGGEYLPEDVADMAAAVSGGGMAFGKIPAGALGMAARSAPDKALPLMLPRAKPKTKAQIEELARRVSDQQLGVHVTPPNKTTNLAGRSKKESARLEALPYTLERDKPIPEPKVIEPKLGDVIVGFPGDQTVSDAMLRSVGNIKNIDSKQEGGSRFALGHLQQPEEVRPFWASGVIPATNVQNKVGRIATLFEPENVWGSHLAMGPTSNDFAMHFADANLKSIDLSKMTVAQINEFDKIISDGFIKENKKTGRAKVFAFPEWPGIANPEAAYEAMRKNPEMRKWFNSRTKVPKITDPLNMPKGQDIQWAITEPDLRNMEINITGHTMGRLKPGAPLTSMGLHRTYSHEIPSGGEVGRQRYLTPFVLSHPDSAQHIASTQRPADFTGTIQKVFPHQVVDRQLQDELGQYYEMMKRFTGKKRGGLVKKEPEGAPSTVTQ